MVDIFYSFVAQFIDSVRSGLGRTSQNTIMIKHYNTFDISKNHIEDIASKYEDIKFLYHEYNSKDMLEAYEPFMEWIRQLYYETSSDIPVDELLDECGVYKLHRNIIKSYLVNQTCERMDEVIYIEVQYEQKKMFESLVQLIRFFAMRQPIILILNKLHRAGNATLILLKKVIQELCDCPIGIIATYNELTSTLPFVHEEWSGLIEELEGKEAIVDWGLNTDLPEESSNGAFQVQISKVDEDIRRIHNMLELLALDEAYYYLGSIYQRLEIEKIYVECSRRYLLLELYAKSSLYTKNITNTLLLCEVMRQVCNESGEDSQYFTYNYWLCMAQIYNGQYKIANQYALACIEYARKSNDQYNIFKADLLKHMVDYAGWYNIWLCDCHVTVDETLIDRCRQYGYINHLAHVYVYAFDNDPELYSKVEGIDERLVYFQKGIDIAKDLENDCLLLQAYKRNIMSASTNGYFDVSTYFNLEKCRPIVLRNNDLFEEANIYNGLGYNCCAMEKFEEANAYFNRAIKIFCDLEMYEYIGETLYNMSINAILAEEYEFADKCLSTCMKIIHILKVESIRVCHISKLHGLKALCNFRMGIMYNCQNHMKSANQFLEHILESDSDNKEYSFWDDDLFMYYNVTAMMLTKEGDYQKAEKYFDKAAIYGNAYKGGAFLNYTQYTVERAKLCRCMGDEEAARKLLLECLEYCKKNKYYYKLQQIEAVLTHTEYEKKKWDLSLQGVTFEGIVEAAKNYGLRQGYYEQKKQIEFLNIWQKLVNYNGYTVDQLVESAILTLKNSFNVDRIIFIRYENGQPVVKYSDARVEMTNEKIQDLSNYFNKSRCEFVTSKMDKNYHDYNEVISVLEEKQISSVLGAPIFMNDELNSIFIVYILMRENWGSTLNRFVIDYGELSVYMFLFHQLLDTIERLEANRKIQQMNRKLTKANRRLQELSIKDMLTGLYNRYGFEERINQVIKSNVANLELSVLYCDLDNFKYYNDHFGHNIGDLLLVSFSQICKKVCQNKGFVVRYGGDEFVIVLFTTNIAEVKAVGTSIYDKIRESSSFIKEIQAEMKQEVQIPPERQLSSSIGIAFARKPCTMEAVKDAIKRADDTLYYIKRNNKHRFEIWDDVKDDIYIE